MRVRLRMVNRSSNAPHKSRKVSLDFELTKRERQTALTPV